MYLNLIFLPFIGAITSGMFGRKIGSKGATYLTVINLFVTFFISCYIFYEVSLTGSTTYVKLCTWINCELFNVDWGFLFDPLTSVMCCVITFISSLVHLYSTEYMSHDPHLPRFMSYLSLFTFFMLILVTADNYVQMFVGWEGVGLCSYLLINFWFTRIQANKAAIKAMIVNRIGDFGLSLGIFTIFVKYKSVDYSTVFSLTPFFATDSFNFLSFDIHVLTLVGILLFVGAVGKSAQLGLHTWLPDAMEGPTPVSALIHAATMVTAGVFLIARSSIIFEYSTFALTVVAVIGACTAFFAATVGLLQNDLKRVIAYSTCSQLGYMVFACGLSNYSVGIFHLTNHAFFKALLFLAAGSVIHAVSDEQDMRKMGGLKSLIPFTYSIMLIGSLALMGFPFLTGFYSKDVILEIAYGNFSNTGLFSFTLGTCGAFLTAFYSTRLLYLTFLTKPNAYKPIIYSVSESSYNINSVLIILAIPSIFIGFYLKDMFIGLGTDFWGNSLFVLPKNMNRIDSEFISTGIKLLPVMLSCLGSILSFILYSFHEKTMFQFKISFIGKKFYNFFNKKWFFDKIYNEYVTQILLKFGYRVTYKIIDKGVIEVFGPLGLSTIILNKSQHIYKLQTGFVYHYSLFILINSTILLGLNKMWSITVFIIDYKILFLLYIYIYIYINFRETD